jgi:hypothetical protein
LANGQLTVGRKNRHCLCETCERRGRGGYAPDHTDDDESDSDSDSDSSDSETDSSDTEGSDEEQKHPLNLNERRTRRGVYAMMQDDEDDSDESEEEETNIPLADAKDIPADEDIEMESAAEAPLPPTPSPSNLTRSKTKKSPIRSISPASSVSTNMSIDWPPNPNDPSAPDHAEFPSGLTPIQHDRLRRKRKYKLWHQTQQAMRSSHKKGRNRDILYQRYRENLVRFKLNTPPPELSETRRVTRSSARLTPSVDATKENDSSLNRSSSRHRWKGKEPAIGAESAQFTPTQSTPPAERRSRRIDKGGGKQVQLATPPMSEERVSVSSAKRAIRSSSLSRSSKTKNEKFSSDTSKYKGKETAEKDKKLTQEPEVRVLRGRPSLLASQSDTATVKSPPSKGASPRGPDGKQLPTCSTCHSILPVISVDSKVVFGAESPTRRRKKKGKEEKECPRSDCFNK